MAFLYLVNFNFEIQSQVVCLFDLNRVGSSTLFQIMRKIKISIDQNDMM